MNEIDIGRRIRAVRRAQGLRQDEVAALSGVGARFVSNLENGKATAELGRTLRVLRVLGIELHLRARTWQDVEQLDAA